MAAFKSVLLRLVYSCSRYSEEYGHGPFWAARKPLFATGNFVSGPDAILNAGFGSKGMVLNLAPGSVRLMSWVLSTLRMMLLCPPARACDRGAR